MDYISWSLTLIVCESAPCSPIRVFHRRLEALVSWQRLTFKEVSFSALSIDASALILQHSCQHHLWTESWFPCPLTAHIVLAMGGGGKYLWKLCKNNPPKPLTPSCKASISSNNTDGTLTYIYVPIWCLHKHVTSFWRLPFAVQFQKERYVVSEQALNDQNLFIATYCVGSHPLAVCLDHRRCQNNLTFESKIAWEGNFTKGKKM